MTEQEYTALLAEWRPQEVLPAAIGSFRQRELTEADRERQRFFVYEEPDKGWEFFGFYSADTDDYMVKYDIGLMIVTEIRFTAGDATAYWAAVTADLSRVLTDRWLRSRETAGVIIDGMGITSWDYAAFLPEQVGPYSLKINPAAPVAGLNGSYIIAAYADKDNDRGLLLFYNTMRDDYFAETRAARVPGMIHDFDAGNLAELEVRLTNRLRPVLESI